MIRFSILVHVIHSGHDMNSTQFLEPDVALPIIRRIGDTWDSSSSQSSTDRSRAVLALLTKEVSSLAGCRKIACCVTRSRLLKIGNTEFLSARAALSLIDRNREAMRDIDAVSLAPSTASTVLPSYESNRDPIPIYDSTVRSYRAGTIEPVPPGAQPRAKAKGFTFPQQIRRQSSRSAPSSNPTLSDIERRRPPPDHLCRTPAQLPPPSTNSPFEDSFTQDLARRASRAPTIAYDNRWPGTAPLHGDYEYHKIHGITDARMHAKPALDRNGQPKREKATVPLIAGAAIGVVALAACNIM